MRYPDAPRLDLVEDLHGRSVSDPYRWLEDAADPRTRAWTEAQDAVTAEVLGSLPLREEFAARLEELVHAGAVGVPVWRGERAFSTRRDPGQEHAVLRVRDAMSTPRVLVRRLAPELVPAGEEQFHRRVWRHRVGTPADTDVLVHGEGTDPTTYFGVHTSRDGRWLIVSGAAGTAPRDDVWIADLEGDGVLRDFPIGVDAQTAAWVARDGRLWLMSD